MPYTKAGKTYTGDVANYRPAFDSQQAIYTALLTDLKWAVDNIVLSGKTTAGNDYVSLGVEETFFGNDLTKWKKFANSLLLRYAMQIVEKDPATATPYIAYALSQNLFIDDGSDVGIWPATVGVVLEGRPWSFGSGGTGFLRISSTMWNLVADGTNPNQIFDPRATIFADTNAAGDYAPYTIGNSNSDKVNPYDYSSTVLNKHDCIYSPLNLYLTRDKHYVPELIMTAAETHFLKAEAYIRGLGVSKIQLLPILNMLPVLPPQLLCGKQSLQGQTLRKLHGQLHNLRIIPRPNLFHYWQMQRLSSALTMLQI